MRKLFSLLFWTGAFVAANAALAGGIAAATLYDRLPTLREIADYRPRLPLRIYAGDGGLIAEFGEEKREFTPYQEFPRDLLNAVIATEDAKFFQHPGLDFAGIVRAALGYFRGRREGASTITMQVAGNFYLNRDRSLLYKISQILLALKIENQFAKEDILELYMNQIYLGAGAFGFAAAARVYYGKELGELTAPEIAVLAGLPQAPSRYHPGQSPELAKARQRHVLNRMLDTQLLTETEHRQLSAAELPPLAPRVSRFSVEAEFFAEEVRKIIYEGVTHDENEIRGVDDDGDGICDRILDRDDPADADKFPPTSSDSAKPRISADLMFTQPWTRTCKPPPFPPSEADCWRTNPDAPTRGRKSFWTLRTCPAKKYWHCCRGRKPSATFPPPLSWMSTSAPSWR